MSVKATISKPRNTPNAQVIDSESPDSVDQFARELGVESITTVGNGTTAEQVEVAEPVTEGAEAPSQALAKRQTHPAPALNQYTANSGGGLEGEFESSDLQMPQLKIVNGSGELSQKFNQGSLILGDQILWTPPSLKPDANNPILTFIPVKVKKQFRENLSQDEVQEGLLPRVVNTRAEAEELTGAGSTEWVGNQKPRWSPSAACMFLVQEPEHNESAEEDSQFIRQLDGKNWALAMYYAGGMAYKESAKVILSNAYTVLRRQGRIVLHARLWTLQVTKKKAGNFGVFVPVLRLTREDTGPDATQAIEDIIGGSHAE